jgi:hypothetical protein
MANKSVSYSHYILQGRIKTSHNNGVHTGTAILMSLKYFKTKQNLVYPLSLRPGSNASLFAIVILSASTLFSKTRLSS